MINDIVCVENINGTWTYSVYLWPIYTHEHSNRAQFRYAASSLINAGLCKQVQIARTFGVDRKMLGRAQKQFRERGAESFFQKRTGRVGATVLTAERLAQAQQLLNEGLSCAEVSAELEIKNKLGRIQGYYSLTQILLALVFMMLARIRSVEQLRGYAPGEFGKLIGLDRIPEVRCLRSKMDAIAGDSQAEQWSCALSEQWLREVKDRLGFLYIDGHVKVYGGEVELPRRFVSRQRLCLRGISSHRVNDAIGQPFFVIEKQIDPGLIDVIKSDIVPRLLKEVPNQPSKEELAADPHLRRFVIVFDREGYSVDFFKYLWDEHRIGCLTYKKNCTAIRAEEEFNAVKTTTATGEPVEMKLAERGCLFGQSRIAG